MAVSTGILQYLVWGVGATPTAAVGTVTGGEIGPGVNPIVHREGIRGQDYIAGGLIDISGSADFLVEDESDANIVEYALRSSYTTPAMTALSFEGGTTNNIGHLHTGVYINTLSLRQSVGEALVASIAWMGTGYTRTGTPSAKSARTGKPYEWERSTFTIDSGTYVVQAITLNLNNNLAAYASLDTATANSMRFPDALNIGSEDLDMSVVLMSPADQSTLFDLTADVIDVDVDVVWVANNGTRKLTVTVSDLACSTNPMPFVAPGDNVLWNVELTGKKNNATTVTIVDAAV